MNNGTASTAEGRSLPPPLRTAHDMPSLWKDVSGGGIDFDSAAMKIIEAHERDGEAQDLPISDIKTWIVAPHEGKFALVPLARHHNPLVLRRAAFSHLMNRIGAPADFLRKLPAPLQIATVNYLLTTHEETSATTLRLRGDEVAAIVSGKYAPLDPEELVDVLRRALVRHGVLRDVRVRGVASGMVDNLRLVFPAEEVAVKVGDVSHVGLDLSTSSFGRSAIHLTPMVWRLVCLNGLRAAERLGRLSFRHIGDAQKLRSAITEGIPTALTHARGLMDQWRRAVDFMVDDVRRQVEQLRELTNPERKKLEEQLRNEAGTTDLPDHLPLYEFTNALTASAKAATPARRLDIEALAGDVLQRHVGSA